MLAPLPSASWAGMGHVHLSSPFAARKAEAMASDEGSQEAQAAAFQARPVPRTSLPSRRDRTPSPGAGRLAFHAGAAEAQSGRVDRGLHLMLQAACARHGRREPGPAAWCGPTWRPTPSGSPVLREHPGRPGRPAPGSSAWMERPSSPSRGRTRSSDAWKRRSGKQGSVSQLGNALPGKVLTVSSDGKAALTAVVVEKKRQIVLVDTTEAGSRSARRSARISLQRLHALWTSPREATSRGSRQMIDRDGKVADETRLFEVSTGKLNRSGIRHRLPAVSRPRRAGNLNELPPCQRRRGPGPGELQGPPRPAGFPCPAATPDPAGGKLPPSASTGSRSSRWDADGLVRAGGAPPREADARPWQPPQVGRPRTPQVGRKRRLAGRRPDARSILRHRTDASPGSTWPAAWSTPSPCRRTRLELGRIGGFPEGTAAPAWLGGPAPAVVARWKNLPSPAASARSAVPRFQEVAFSPDRRVVYTWTDRLDARQALRPADRDGDEACRSAALPSPATYGPVFSGDGKAAGDAQPRHRGRPPNARPRSTKIGGQPVGPAGTPRPTSTAWPSARTTAPSRSATSAAWALWDSCRTRSCRRFPQSGPVSEDSSIFSSGSGRWLASREPGWLDRQPVLPSRPRDGDAGRGPSARPSPLPTHLALPSASTARPSPRSSLPAGSCGAGK